MLDREASAFVLVAVAIRTRARSIPGILSMSAMGVLSGKLTGAPGSQLRRRLRVVICSKFLFADHTLGMVIWALPQLARFPVKLT